MKSFARKSLVSLVVASSIGSLLPEPCVADNVLAYSDKSVDSNYEKIQDMSPKNYCQNNDALKELSVIFAKIMFTGFLLVLTTGVAAISLVTYGLWKLYKKCLKNKAFK